MLLLLSPSYTTAQIESNQEESQYPIFQQKEFLLPSGLKFVAPTIAYLDFPLFMPMKGRIAHYVDFYANLYDLSANLLMDIIECESKFKINAIGDKGKAYGLFQFWEKTFNQFKKESGFMDLDYKNWQDQIQLASWGIANGKAPHWTCFKLVRK